MPARLMYASQQLLKDHWIVRSRMFAEGKEELQTDSRYPDNVRQRWDARQKQVARGMEPFCDNGPLLFLPARLPATSVSGQASVS